MLVAVLQRKLTSQIWDLPAAQAAGRVAESQTGLYALYLMGTAGVWGLLACKGTSSVKAVFPAPAGVYVLSNFLRLP